MPERPPVRHSAEDLIAWFDRAGNNPTRWRDRAKELLASSRKLLRLWEAAIQHDPPRPIVALKYDAPAIMLRAMAFECLLKARAVEQGVVLARGGRYRKIPGIRDHDLVALAERVGLDPTPREKAVLLALSRRITYGRYPIQQRWTDQHRLRPDGLVEFLSSGWHPNWDEPCETLLARLRKGPVPKT